MFNEEAHIQVEKLPLTLIPLGYFEDLSPLGGGGGGEAHISATNGPIDLKIGTVIKKSQIEYKKYKKLDLYLFIFLLKFLICKSLTNFWGKLGFSSKIMRNDRISSGFL